MELENKIKELEERAVRNLKSNLSCFIEISKLYSEMGKDDVSKKYDKLVIAVQRAVKDFEK